MGESVLNLIFQKIEDTDISYFRNLLPELGKFYDGHENSKFFDQLIDKEKGDINGYFTLKKEIWVAKDVRGVFNGFVCLNYKRGNTVKIGPIIVSPPCRGKGVGKFLISSSIEKLKKENVRKIYATTSSENVPASKLFANNGFRLEVELPEQYKKGNVELIWGYFIDSPTEIFVNDRSLLSNQEDSTTNVSLFDKSRDENYLAKTLDLISGWHDDIDPSFVNQVIEATERGLDFETKGKLILVSRNSSKTQTGIAVAAPKRGGSVKVYPLYGNTSSIAFLVKELTLRFSSFGYRKLYTFSHADDEKYMNELFKLGFTLRGSLSSPYKSGHDLAVFDMFI